MALPLSVPPEGLNWSAGPEPEDAGPPERVLALVRARPVAAPGVLPDADAARNDGRWTCAYDDTPGVRTVIPWSAEAVGSGEVRLDFARDEWLPEPPVWTAVPPGDGSAPMAVRTAGRELALAWKLLWLHTDGSTEGRAQAKDLHDAVLLAEVAAGELSPRLLRTVFRYGRGTADAAPRLEGVGLEPTMWDEFRAEHPAVRGTAAQWLQRLRRALEPLPLAQ